MIPKNQISAPPATSKGTQTADSGTSAANSVCAGVIGLLKSYDPTLTMDVIKEALQKTAKDLCEQRLGSSLGLRNDPGRSCL